MRKSLASFLGDVARLKHNNAINGYHEDEEAVIKNRDIKLSKKKKNNKFDVKKHYRYIGGAKWRER